jgi:hypothetical protein
MRRDMTIVMQRAQREIDGMARDSQTCIAYVSEAVPDHLRLERGARTISDAPTTSPARKMKRHQRAVKRRCMISVDHKKVMNNSSDEAAPDRQSAERKIG